VRNYIQLFLVVDTDGMGSVITYGFTFSLQEGIDYINANFVHPAGPPKMYYFHLNKWNTAVLISQYPWSVQPDGTITPEPQLFTEDRAEALDFNINNPLFYFDASDPASVEAARVARDKLGEP
jgi:hypothetical protein